MSETRMVTIDTQQIEAGLAVLKQTADSIVVKDAPTCLAAKTAQRANPSRDLAFMQHAPKGAASLRSTLVTVTLGAGRTATRPAN